MVMSFYITMTSQIDVRPACCWRESVRFYLSHRLVRVCETNRIHHWCSVVPEKSQPSGPTFQWETRLAKFPTGTLGPRVGIFLEPLNTNDRFFFSYTTTVRYSTVKYLLMTSLRMMFTVNDARCTNQFETVNKQRIKQ